MVSLQQFEEAEERVQRWHGDMRHCMSQQQAQEKENGQRRSWRTMLAHCLRQVAGRRVRRQSSVSVLHFRRGTHR